MHRVFVIGLGAIAMVAPVLPALAQNSRDMPAGVSGGVGTGSGMGTGATSGVTRGGAVSGTTPGVTRREESARTQTGLSQTGVPPTPDTPTTIDRQTGLPTSPSASPANRTPEDPRELISPRVRARQSGDPTTTPLPPSGSVTEPAGPRPTR